MGKGKQRNSRRLRPHELTEDDLETVDKPQADEDDDEERQPIRPPKIHVSHPRHAMPYVEGDVVMFGDTTGTVFMIVGHEYHVLDSTGLMHIVRGSELTPVQSA